MTTGSRFGSDVSALIGRHVPGLAVVVVDAGHVVAVEGLGAADLAQGTPASSDMICPWFSMTKIATATVAVALSERGLLDLDAPVAPLVPALSVLRPAEQAASITPRHLLSHSAGLPNPIPVSWVHPADRPGPDPGTFLDSRLRAHPRLKFEPGSRSSYSNLGTLILGAAIASVAGRPYTEVVRTELLVPLGMTRTGFAYSGAMERDAATGYHPRRSPMRYLLPRWVIGEPSGRWIGLRRFLLDGSAYGGLVGSPDDAARLLRMHLRDGELHGTRIISEEGARAMRHITVRGTRFDLGLGWFRPAERREASFVEHLGGGAGFFNVMRLDAAKGRGVVVMGNATKYDIDLVAESALS